MLSFLFSFGAFAGNVVSKEKKNLIEKNEKKFLGFCVSVEPFYVGCPDGSEFLGGFDVSISICGGGVSIPVDVVSVSTDWGDDPCNEGGWNP